MRLLLLAVVATPIVAFWPQDPDAWDDHVRKACESRRYGIRLAAAKRAADGGAAAVPAIKAYATQHGKNAIPSALVDAIADSQTYSVATTQLLKTWATDSEFYWRSSAMRGLALRAGAKPAQSDGSDASKDATQAIDPRTTLEPSMQSGQFFEPFANDPAWLMRTHARFGLMLLGRPVATTPDQDPRANVRLTRLLLDEGQLPPLQPLIDALADERTFLGNTFGAYLGKEASKALHQWLGSDFPELAPGDQPKSIAAILAAATKKSGQRLTTPTTKTDPAHDIVGGFEIASCKFGDQFVQWSTDGTLHFGIDAARSAKLPADKWQELLQQRTALALDGDVGEVVCDKLQLVLTDPQTRVNVAPSNLPTAAAEWLKRLAQSLEEVNETEAAADIRRGLGQFEGR